MCSACGIETKGPGRRLPRLWAALLALGFTAALAACNGGGDGGQSPTAEPTGTGTPTGQVTAAACEALTSLEKYRYLSDVTLESPEDTLPVEDRPTPVPTLTREFTGEFYFRYNIDASLMAPDRIQAEMRLLGNDDPSNPDDDSDTIADKSDNCPFASNPGQENADGDAIGDACEGVNVIVVGDQHWSTVGERWEEVGPQYIVPYQPLDICNAIFAEVNLSQVKGEKESVNDVSAWHYTFSDAPSGQAMATIFGAGSDMDILLRAMNVEVWLAEKDGWPVRMDIQSSGMYGDGRELRAHVRFELRDINGEDIKIEAPI